MTLPVTIHTLVLGPLQTNCYVLRGGDACWVVDPGPLPRELMAMLREQGLSPQRVLLTHGHGDHIAGVKDLRKAFSKVRVACPAAEAGMLTDARANLSSNFGIAITVGPPDELLEPGQALTCGPSEWRVLDTSGHTPGGMSFYCQAAGVAIVGDALFDGSIGRCDLPGGDMSRLVANIRANLLILPDDTRILPGHGPETTVGRQKRHNPYL